MRDGMYDVVFQADKGSSKSSIVMQNGKIFGVDEGGATYDGAYVPAASGLTELRIKVSMPANAMSVLGIAGPEAWSIDLTALLDLTPEHGQIRMDTPTGRPLDATYRYLRPIPA